ncbi:hypothetical protein [Streptomyces sp. NPDC101393]|uniref:hypothetical protein n=1 Tax=Streptomyces sp. NPDC101393 TaxID=3366141 RepID=UPI0037FF49AE
MTEDIAALVRQLAATERADRREASERLVALGAPAVGHLLPLLREPIGTARSAAESCVERLGEPGLAALRKVRVEGPGQFRATALRVLADTGGADALSPADRAAVERLVRVKLPDEAPDDLPIHAWIAVPGADVTAILAALELHDARPVTTAMGVSAAVDHENSLTEEASDGSETTAYRVFISPEFEGWRLLYGTDYVNENWAQAVEKLSTHCREAHFYVVDEYNGSWVWSVWENGRVTRGYSTYGDPQWEGEPLEFERDLVLDEDDEMYDPEEAEAYADGVRDPEEVASALSIQPTTVAVLDKVGHGWLAVTDPDVGHGRFRGALPV